MEGSYVLPLTETTLALFPGSMIFLQRTFAIWIQFLATSGHEVFMLNQGSPRTNSSWVLNDKL